MDRGENSGKIEQHAYDERWIEDQSELENWLRQEVKLWFWAVNKVMESKTVLAFVLVGLLFMHFSSLVLPVRSPVIGLVRSPITEHKIYGYVVGFYESYNVTMVVPDADVVAGAIDKTYSTKSNSTGFYELSVPEGKFAVKAFKIVDGVHQAKPRKTYELTVDRDIRLDVEVICGFYVIIGNILDINIGEPIQGATILVSGQTRDGGIVHKTVLADEQGFFNTAVDEGTYTLTASAFGYNNPDAVSVSIPPSKFVAYRLKALPMGISGNVFDDIGKPVRNASVSIKGKITKDVQINGSTQRVEQTVYGPFTNITDPEGSFGFDSLPPVEVYEITAGKLGYEVAGALQPMPAGSGYKQRNLVINLNAARLDIAVKSMTYSERPLEGVNVTLAGVCRDTSGDWNDGKPLTNRTDSQGTVSFGRLLPGPYLLNLNFSETIEQVVRIPVGRKHSFDVITRKIRLPVIYYPVILREDLKEKSTLSLTVYMEPINGTLQTNVARITDLLLNVSAPQSSYPNATVAPSQASYITSEPGEFKVMIDKALSPNPRWDINITRKELSVPAEVFTRGLFRLQLPPGKYLLRFEKSGHWPRSIEVTVGSNMTTYDEAILTPTWDYVVGSVWERGFNETLVNATVSIAGERTQTDIFGGFVLRKVPGNRTQTLNITCSGYQSIQYQAWLPGSASIVLVNGTSKLVVVPNDFYEGGTSDFTLAPFEGSPYDFRKGPPEALFLFISSLFVLPPLELLPNWITPLGQIRVNVKVNSPIYDDEGNLVGSQLIPTSAVLGLVTPEYSQRFAWVSDGTTIEVSTSGVYAAFINGYNFRIDQSTRPYVDVRSGQTLTLIFPGSPECQGNLVPLTTPFTYWVFGRVYDLINLKCVQGVNVKNGLIDGSTLSTTDAQGRFSFSGTASTGVVNVTFVKQGYVTPPPEQTYPWPVAVTNRALDPRAITLRIELREDASDDTDSIKGIDKPVDEASVDAWVFRNKTNTAGVYVVPGGLGTGTYTIRISKPGYKPLHLTLKVLLPIEGRDNLTANDDSTDVAAEVPLGEGNRNKTLNVKIKPLPWIRLLEVKSEPRLETVVIHGIRLEKNGAAFKGWVNATLRRASNDIVAEKYRWDKIARVDVILSSGQLRHSFPATLVKRDGWNETWSAQIDVASLPAAEYAVSVVANTDYGSEVFRARWMTVAQQKLVVAVFPTMVYAVHSMGRGLVDCKGLAGFIKDASEFLGLVKIETNATAEVVKDGYAVYVSSLTIESDGPLGFLPAAFKPLAKKILQLPTVTFRMVSDFHGKDRKGSILALLHLEFWEKKDGKTLWETTSNDIADATLNAIVKGEDILDGILEKVGKLREGNIVRKKVNKVIEELKKDMAKNFNPKTLDITMLLLTLKANVYAGLALNADLEAKGKSVDVVNLSLGPGVGLNIEASLRVPVEKLLLSIPAVGQAAYSIVEVARYLGVDLVAIYIKGRAGGGLFLPVNWTIGSPNVNFGAVIPLGFGIGLEGNVAIIEGEAWADLNCLVKAEKTTTLLQAVVGLSLSNPALLFFGVQPKSLTADIVLKGELSANLLIKKFKLLKDATKIPLVYEYYGTESVVEVRDMNITLMPYMKVIEEFIGRNNTLVNRAFDSANPAVAYDAQGSLHLLYSGDSAALRYPDSLVINHTTLRKGSWTQPVQLSPGLKPSIARLADGRLVATWSLYRGSLKDPVRLLTSLNSTEVYCSAHTDGLGWSRPEALTQNGFADLAPIVRAYGQGAIAVWKVDQDSEMLTLRDNDLHYSVFDRIWSDPKPIQTGGNIWGLPSLSSPGRSAAVAFALDTDGRPETVNDREIYCSFFDGEKWGGSMRITDNAYEDSSPSIALFENGTALLAWIMRTGEQDELLVSRFDGSSWSTPTLLVSSPRLSEPMLVSGTQHIVLLYLAPTAQSPSSINYMIYNGSAWTGESMLSPDDLSYEQLSADLDETTGEVTVVSLGREPAGGSFELRYFTFNIPAAANMLIIKAPPGAQVEVNGIQYALGSMGTLAVTVPRQTRVCVSQTVDVDPGRSRLFFERWEDGSREPSRQVSFLGRLTVEASYKKQHFLTVSSDHATGNGTGWYTEGSQATISVEPTRLDVAWVLVQDVFKGWIGDVSSDKPTAVVTVASPLSISAVWERDYTVLLLLILAVSGAIAFLTARHIISRRSQRRLIDRSKSTPNNTGQVR